MNIKLKFPPESVAFFIKSETEFLKIKIKSAAIGVTKDSGVTIMYRSETEGESPFDQNDLLDKLEFFKYVGDHS
jgi:hypothetical protein